MDQLLPENQTPLISIVLPTYNGGRYLGQSIQSCLDQTYSNWELIVVDDCSTDETAEIVQAFRARDSRIRSIRNDSNRKLPQSLNIGFEHAKGELFTWTSDDNLFEPRALESMADGIRLGADFVYANQMVIDEDGREMGIFEVEPPERLFEENVVNACFLYKREVHESLGGYDPNQFLVEDWHFWIRAAEKFRLKPIPGTLYRYRQHGSSLSSLRKQQVVENTIRLKANYLLPKLAIGEKPSRLLALADLASTVGNVSLRKELAWRALRTAPMIALWRYGKWMAKHLLNISTQVSEKHS